jgi:hypothetical protein
MTSGNDASLSQRKMSNAITFAAKVSSFSAPTQGKQTAEPSESDLDRTYTWAA